MEFFKPSNALINEMKASSALKMRKIFLSDEVGRDSIFEVLYFLEKLVSLDKKINSKEPIEIIVDSFGGTIYHGLSLVSKICELKDLGYTIITTVSGTAMSMGSAISIVGSKRRAYRYATLLIHQPDSNTWGTLKGQKEDIAETERLWELMKNIIKENSNITEEQLEEIYQCKRDWYFSAQEALELGIIDEIM